MILFNTLQYVSSGMLLDLLNTPFLCQRWPGHAPFRTCHPFIHIESALLRFRVHERFGAKRATNDLQTGVQVPEGHPYDISSTIMPRL